MFTGLLSLLGVGSFLGVIAKAFEAIIGAAAPALKAAVEFVIWFLKACWEGFCDVMDNVHTILFVGVIAAGTYLYAHNPLKDVQIFAGQKRVVKLNNEVKQLKATLKDMDAMLKACRTKSPSQRPTLGKVKR